MKVTKRIKTEAPEGYQHTLVCCLNPDDNGGESVILAVDVFDNGDPPPNNISNNISIETVCYGTHSTSLGLSNINLGQLAEAIQALQLEMTI